MNRFYSGQLVVVLKDLNAKLRLVLGLPHIEGSIGKVLQRRDYNGTECYDVSLDDYDGVCYMYVYHLQALPKFKFNFKKVREVETI